MSKIYSPPSAELRVLLTPSELIAIAALAGVPWVRLNDASLWPDMHRDPKLLRYISLSAADGLHKLVRDYLNDNQTGRW